MNTCVNLENGTCKAFAVFDRGFKITTHVPKFCAADMSFGGNEFQPQILFTARCLARNSVADQQQCDDFKEGEPQE